MNFIWSSSLFRKDKDEEQIMNAIKGCYLFSSLSSKELSIIRASVHIRKYNVGESAFQQHQPGMGMYIIVNGKVSIEDERVFVDPNTGKEKNEAANTSTLEAGDFFGELALVEDESDRTATARIMEPSRLIGFFKPDLIQIINTRPSLGMKLTLKLAQIIAGRLRQVVEELHKTRFHK